MPTPKPGESEKDFVSRCVPIVMGDGTTNDNKQAVAICYSMYRREKKDADMEAINNMMGMDAEDYAKQEAWGLQTSANVLGTLAALAVEETDEPPDLQALANIMRSLLAYITGQISQMVDSAKQGVEGKSVEVEEIPAELKKAPDSDFLVVDDQGQHLRVKENGKINHRLMGAAWAALHGGYRGNKYQGSGKEGAIAKLRRLYKAEGMDVPSEGKSAYDLEELDLSYVKSLQIDPPDFLAVKFVAKDEIKGYSHLWGNENLTDIEIEYFTPNTDFWDNRFDTKTRPLTWDHAQDPTFKDNPVIGEIMDFGDDEIGRWYIAKLERSHQYNKAIAELIKQGRLGTSSDSAPQYVERVKTGKATWLKTWPFFAAALTDAPCEPRMIGSLEFLKSLGIELPDTPVTQTPTWEAEAAVINYFRVKYHLGD